VWAPSFRRSSARCRSLSQKKRVGSEARQAAWREEARRKAEVLQQRFLAGFACKWTPVADLAGLHCPVNCRTDRVIRGVDRIWLFSKTDTPRDGAGVALDRYRRADVTRVVAKAAQPDAHSF
jgi:hypothetical protein